MNVGCCRRGAATGSQPFSPQTPVTSPPDFMHQVDEQQSSLFGLIDELNSLSGGLWTGHVTADQEGYDSADRHSWHPDHLTGQSVPKQEASKENWKEDIRADGGRQLDTRDSLVTRPTFLADFDQTYYQKTISTEEETVQASPISPPPPPPLPAPALTPVPSTNFHVAGSGTKTFPVKVFGV